MTTASPELIVSLRQMTHHGCSLPSNAGRRVSLFEPHTQIIRKGKAGNMRCTTSGPVISICCCLR